MKFFVGIQKPGHNPKEGNTFPKEGNGGRNGFSQEEV